MSIFNIFKRKKEVKQIVREPSTLFENNCRHGKYNHQVFYKCCNTYVDCYLCHKEKCHEVNRPILLKIRCIHCGCIQSSSNQCKNSECEVKFSDHFCKICTVWSSNTNKSHHCNKCNICYIEPIEKLIHCDTCNICYYKSKINNHRCIKNKNLQDIECQICLEKVNNSHFEVCTPDCGHDIHRKCFNEYKKSCYEQNKLITCCICRKSMIKSKEIEKKFDNLANNWSLSSNQKKWLSYISCNDCEGKSLVKYHPKYRKCLDCNSYNNIEQSIIKDIEEKQNMPIPSAPLLGIVK
jgi:hypothetical protein